jgi:hypothetical protein
MEEWSRKLKLLHWTCIERADGVSPLICRDDDDDGDSDDGSAGETFEGGSAFEGGFDTGGGNAPDSSTGETFEGGSAFEGGFDTGGGNAPDGSSFEGGPGGSGTGGGGSNESVNDFASLDNSPAQGYTEYGSNVEQGTGAGAAATAGAPADAAAASASAAAATGQGPSDFLSASQSITPDVQTAALGAQPSKEEQQEGKDKDTITPDIPSGFGNFRDLPDPNAPIGREKEIDKEFEKEIEKEFQREREEQAPTKEPQSTLESLREAIASSLVSTAQAATLSPAQQAAQAAAQAANPGVPQEYYGKDGPLTDPNKEPGRPSFDYLPGIDDKEREKEEQKDSPFGQQAAFNTFGFNPTTPTGYNMPSAISGAPTGAPPTDQQVATGQQTIDVGPPSPALGTSVATTPYGQSLAELITEAPPAPNAPPTQTAPTPTSSQVFDPTAISSQVPSAIAGLTPAPAPTGKGDREVREGRTDPFGKDAQQPDIFDPNTFTPSVGMLMSNIPSMQTTQEWPTPSTPAQAFGPQAPTQATTQTAQAPTQEQLTREQLDILTNPTPYGPMTSQQVAGVRGPDVPDREARERERPENREPVVVDIPPGPSRTVDIPSHNQYEWPAQAPGRDFKVDASGNLSFAPTAQPSVTGGVPLGDLPGGGFPSSQPGTVGGAQGSQGGGGSGVVQLPQQQRQQLSAQRKRLPLTAQERRDAITEALMRRDLNAAGVSDFDRLRLQP